jgi:hypothetical protein
VQQAGRRSRSAPLPERQVPKRAFHERPDPRIGPTAPQPVAGDRAESVSYTRPSSANVSRGGSLVPDCDRWPNTVPISNARSQRCLQGNQPSRRGRRPHRAAGCLPAPSELWICRRRSDR